MIIPGQKLSGEFFQTDYECSGAFLFWESVVLLYVTWINLSKIEV